MRPHVAELAGLYREPSLLEIEPPKPGANSEIGSILGAREDFHRIRTYAHEPANLSPELRYQARLAFLRFLPFQGPQDLKDEITQAENALREAIAAFPCNGETGPRALRSAWDLYGTDRGLMPRLETWKRLCDLGHALVPHHLQVVTLRNRLAREQGFEHNLQYAFALHELDDPAVSEALQDALTGTHRAMESVKRDLDNERAGRFKTTRTNLRAWHYDHPLRLLKRWQPREGDPKFSRRTWTSLKSAFMKLGLPRVDGEASAPGRAPETRPSPAEQVAELSTAVRWAARHLFREERLQPSPNAEPHPVLCRALEWLIFDQLVHTDVLSHCLGMEGSAALRFRAAFTVQWERENLVSVRHGASLATFDATRARSPGLDMGDCFWSATRTAFGYDERQGAGDLWAASVEVLEGRRPWLEDALAVLLGHQIKAALPPAPPGKSLFLHPQTWGILEKHLLLPAGRRPWTEIVRALCGATLSAASFVKHTSAHA